MHANVSCGDRVSPKFIIVKGLDDALKRLRLAGAAPRELRRLTPLGHEFINIEIEPPIAKCGPL